MSPHKGVIRAMTDEQLLGALILDRSNASVYCGEILHRHGMGNPLFKTYIESYNKYCGRQGATDNVERCHPLVTSPPGKPPRSSSILLLLMRHIIKDRRHYAGTTDSLINKLRSCLPKFREYIPSHKNDEEFVELAKTWIYTTLITAEYRIWDERAAIYYAEYSEGAGALTGHKVLWDMLTETDESVPNEQILADYLKQKEGKRA